MSVATRLEALRPAEIGIPGPSTWDMVRAFRSVRSNPLPFLTDVSGRFGHLVAFPVPGPPALLLGDPDDVRHVLQTSSRRWGKRTVQYSALARVTGPGLLASAEPSWIEHRRVAGAAFHHRRLDAVGAQVRCAADEALAQGLGPRPPRTGVQVDVGRLGHRIALDAVGRALFSSDLTEHADRLLTATGDAADLVVRVGRSVVPTPPGLPTPTTSRLRSTRRRLDAIAAVLIEQRRARPGAADGSGHGDDLLGLLVDSSLPDAQIRDELVTMVIAGHETVAAALTWMLLLLAEHPEVQERARAELAAHPGPVSLLDGEDRLPWTRAVVDETLRLYPPAWAISRRSTEADTVGGVDLPPGTLAIISPWVLHRDPAAWPDPLAFRPERFLDRRTARPGYLPFGQGPRLCIGRDFALGELTVVLSRLLAAVEVSLPPGWRRPDPRVRIAVHPRTGTSLVLTPRRGATGA